MLTKEEILKNHLHGLSSEQFNEDIKHFPLIEILPAMEEYENQDKWVSAETLPEETKRVLLLRSSGYTETGYHYKEWYSDSSFISLEDQGFVVTHWQPLPKPPKQ